MNASAKTAITRKNLSVPMAYLLKAGKLRGQCLDYGCGKGFDCDALAMEGFDLNHRPEVPTAQYDTIICNYVLNVIESPGKRWDVVEHIRSLLEPWGVAYISVRNDSFVEGYRRGGTWQGKVSVPGGRLVYSCGAFRMYEVKITCN